MSPAMTTPRTMLSAISPILFATTIEWAMLLGIGWLWTDLRTVVGVCAFVPLANLILFALENTIALYYPRRPGATTAFQGRHMALNLVKSLSIFAAGGVSAAAGVGVYWLTGQSTVAGIVAAWCTAGAIGVGLIPIVAYAFRGMDPSMESLE